MSFGFVRKQSPASIAQDRRRRAGRRFKMLTDLRVSEVSSVDRAANPGARVLLMKRAVPEGEPDMPTLQERITKSHNAARSGEISFVEAGLQQQQRASEAFPLAKSLGEALHLYGQTEIGKRDIHTLKDLEFLKQQWDTRLCNAAEVIAKAEAEPHVEHAQCDGIDGDGDVPFDEKLAHLKNAGFNDDEAHSMLHRAWKLKRGIG
jgi:hypothetical protein